MSETMAKLIRINKSRCQSCGVITFGGLIFGAKDMQCRYTLRVNWFKIYYRCVTREKDRKLDAWEVAAYASSDQCCCDTCSLGVPDNPIGCKVL